MIFLLSNYLYSITKQMKVHFCISRIIFKNQSQNQITNYLLFPYLNKRVLKLIIIFNNSTNQIIPLNLFNSIKIIIQKSVQLILFSFYYFNILKQCIMNIDYFLIIQQITQQQYKSTYN
eukprot:TRINITY_DN349_c0_g1_i15.p2 TRINITY_DN349_c0_g1~~TRINITY_DN349_c0_g1_i15.p2  ORF type:complete len:119 (+),score=4.50 TRINITY_DN349_c0_g1_i15:260-616(+)